MNGTVPVQRQVAKMSELPSAHDRLARDRRCGVCGSFRSDYEQCLVHELEAREIPLQRQVARPVVYRNHRIDTEFRMDVVAGGPIVVEVKAAEKILPVHGAQLVGIGKYPTLFRSSRMLRHRYEIGSDGGEAHAR